MFYVQYSDSDRMKSISEVYKWRRKLKYFKNDLSFMNHIFFLYIFLLLLNTYLRSRIF